jgi:hypothetical protein
MPPSRHSFEEVRTQMTQAPLGNLVQVRLDAEPVVRAAVMDPTTATTSARPPVRPPERTTWDP